MGVREVTPEIEKQLTALKSNNPKLYYVGCGTADPLAYQSSKTLVAELKKLGFEYTYRETDHGHWWGAWRIYLSEFAPQLFR